MMGVQLGWLLFGITGLVCSSEGNPCLQNNGECEHECRFEADDKVCTCRTGFQLESDGISCTDIDECTMSYAACAQICTNSVGSFECSCMSGYTEDGDRCKATEGSARLVFYTRNSIKEFSFETNTSRDLLDGLHTVVAIDFDVKANILYYSDIYNDKICQTTFDGSQQSVIVNEGISTSEGMSFDWVHGNIYWSDTGYNTISLISLSSDKHYRKTLVSEGLDQPRAVVVDPREGQRWLYWTDWGDDAKIERAGLDGSSRMIVVNKKDVAWPDGLTIDFTNNRFYWTDAKLNRIGTAKLDGTDVRILIEDSFASQQPFSIDVFEDWIFWTDWTSKGIYKTEKSIGTEPQLVLGDVIHSMGMRVYHKIKQPFSRNVCGVNNGGCVQLCLPSPAVYPGSPEYRCAYADDMVGMTTTTTNQLVNSTTTTVEATEAMSNETMWPDYSTDDVSEILEVAGIVFGVAAIVAIVATLGMFM